MKGNGVYQWIRRIFTPPGTLLYVLIPLSAVLLVWSLGSFNAPAVVCYVSYLLSAYTFGAVCCRLLPRLSRLVWQILSKNRLVMLYITDIRVHVSVGLYVSQAINLAYAAFQFYLGVHQTSVWYTTMGFYYSLLFLMRCYLLIYIGRHDPGEDRQAELRRYRFCGRCLVVLNAVLAVVILLTIQEHHYTAHHMVVAIAMATYTFAVCVLTLVHIASYRRYHSPVFTASVNISLVSSLVSMLNLEATMLVTFGTADQDAYNQLMIAITGLVIVVIIQALAAAMIRSSGRELKEIAADG